MAGLPLPTSIHALMKYSLSHARRTLQSPAIFPAARISLHLM
jgi:hypothetical protein